MVKPSDLLLDRLACSEEYGEYIMNHCPIGNGDALIAAVERLYLWEAFLASKGIDLNDSN